MHMRRLVVSLVALLAIDGGRAAAQAATVGVLTKMRGLRAAPPCPASRAVVRPEPALRIVRAQAAIGVTASQLDNSKVPVQLLDSIVVPRNSDARLMVESDFGRGLFVLTPDFGLCMSSERDVYPGGGPDTTSHASYKIGTHRDPATGRDALELAVRTGAATVEWSKGLLYVYALTKHIQVTGTEFVVRVDSSFSSAFIYVKNGTVRFEEFPGIEASTNQLLWWTPTSMPELLTPQPSGLRQDYSFHARDVWKSPHLTRNIALGVGGTAALIVVVRKCCRGSNRRRGTIVVGLPL